MISSRDENLAIIVVLVIIALWSSVEAKKSEIIGRRSQNSDGHYLREAAPRINLNREEGEKEAERTARSVTRFKRRIDRRQQQQMPGGPSKAGTNQSLPLPEFSAPIGNVTAVLGRDVRLVCTIDNLGPYQVAWLKEETRTILSIDTNIIITNYRIFLIPDEEGRKWVLHIKDVQESDRGFYQCQVNTKPMRSTSGYLEVVVPPKIIESQTSQVAEVLEHSHVSVQCKASGHPKATITWRRDDGLPIKLSGGNAEPEEPALLQPDAGQATAVSRLNEVKSDRLALVNVDRSMGGQYVCIASNGIPSQATKTIPIHVKFPPKVHIQSKFVSVSLGDQLELDCLIESFPKANSYWSKEQQKQPVVAASATTAVRALLLQKLWLPSTNGSTNVAARPDSWHGTRRQLDIGPSERRALFRAGRLTSGSAPAATDGSAGAHGGGSSDAGGLAGRGGAGRRRRFQSIVAQHTDASSNLMESMDSPNRRGDLGPASMADEPLDGVEAGETIANYEEGAGERVSVSTGHQSIEFGGTLASKTEHEGQQMRQAFRVLPNDTHGDEKGKATNSAADRQQQSVSVKQVPVSLYAYKLKLTIGQMALSDYGEYTCHSSNLLGSSEGRVIVTMADKQENSMDDVRERESERQASTATRSQSLDASDYQRDSLPSFVQVPPKQMAMQRPSQTWSQSSQSGRVYDENYLQAIKNRQAANFGAASASNSVGKLQQQKYKMRALADRNGEAQRKADMWLQLVCLTISGLILMRLNLV